MTTFRWWSPGTDLVAATRLMDRLFDQALGSPQQESEGGTPMYNLPIDILETDDSYVLYASVAGAAGDSVDVTFEEGVLSISVKATPFEKQGRWIRQERPWGNWRRRLELPKEVDPDRITAQVDNGMLTVTVPKAATAQPVRIPVGGAKKLEG